MTPFFLASLSSALLGWLMGFLSVFLILLVLIQRGRGGGLTGALGGPGGQSAFGSKAGDTFTIITVVVAAVWGFSCAFTMWLHGTHAPTTTAADRSTLAPGPGDEDELDPSDRLLPTGDTLEGLIGDGAANGGEDGDTEADDEFQLAPADGGAEGAGDESEAEAADEEDAASAADAEEGAAVVTETNDEAGEDAAESENRPE